MTWLLRMTIGLVWSKTNERAAVRCIPQKCAVVAATAGCCSNRVVVTTTTTQPTPVLSSRCPRMWWRVELLRLLIVLVVVGGSFGSPKKDDARLDPLLLLCGDSDQEPSWSCRPVDVVVVVVVSVPTGFFVDATATPMHRWRLDP